MISKGENFHVIFHIKSSNIWKIIQFFIYIKIYLDLKNLDLIINLSLAVLFMGRKTKLNKKSCWSSYIDSILNQEIAILNNIINLSKDESWKILRVQILFKSS